MSYDPLNSSLIPFKVCSSVVSLDQYLPDWTLAEIDTDATLEPRSFVQYIPFDSPFANVPLVHAGITGFDIDNRDTGRLSVGIEGISNSGFNIVVQTWMNTRVYKVEVSWFALGNE